MIEPLEHQSIYPKGHKGWRPGLSCAACDKRKDANLAQQRGRSFQVTGLTQSLERGHGSIHEAEKQAVAAARANGIEPERAPN